jgi:hypothetical protein
MTWFCRRCQVFARVAGPCTFCHRAMQPVEEAEAAPQPVPCPDWPEADPDKADQRPVTKLRRPRKSRDVRVGA